MLCTADGCPVAVEVFAGNTADPAALGAQIVKLKARFGLSEVVWVDDRGMITSARIEPAQDKVASHTVDDGTPAHSFSTLIAELGRVVRNTCRTPGADN